MLSSKVLSKPCRKLETAGLCSTLSLVRLAGSCVDTLSNMSYVCDASLPVLHLESLVHSLLLDFRYLTQRLFILDHPRALSVMQAFIHVCCQVRFEVIKQIVLNCADSQYFADELTHSLGKQSPHTCE